MRKIFASAIFLGTVLLATSGMAALYDFESVPSGSHGDNVDIFDQYPGVLFFIDNNGNDAFDAGTDAKPTFEQVGQGDAEHGFKNDVLDQFDVASAGSLGQYFMKASSDVFSTGGTTFVILFDSPVSYLSGEIWDIDGTSSQNTEGWHLETLGAGQTDDTPIYSTNTGPGGDGDLDGVAWTWQFTTQTPEIDGLVISFTGGKQNNVGLAIDNITTRTVPIPGAVWLLGSGLLGLVGFRRFKK